MITDLAAFIQQRRAELGLSQAKVSERTNKRLSHTTVANLEKGIDPRTGKARQPRPETLKIIAPAIDVTYEELAEKAGYITREDNQEYDAGTPSLDLKPLSDEEKAVIRAMRAARKGGHEESEG